MAHARFHIDAVLAAILLAVGCGDDDRDNDPSGGGPGDDGGTADDGGDDGDDDGGDDGETGDDGATGDDGTTGGGDTTDGGSDGVPPGECPPSGKEPPTGCWSNPGGTWEDVRCGCGPAISQTGGPDGSAEDISQCSHFADVGGLHDEINQIRDSYVDSGMTLCHSRYKGIPWEGENAGMTWPSYFTWDDCLAEMAQALAEDIAAGAATHGGTRVDGQNGCCADFYMDNLFEDDFRITFTEAPGEYDNGSFALSQGNGSARMGLFYHDFDGDGPVIQQIGIGASADANCNVTWVLQFGP
jgi:hypothetical protein